jgi:EAL and modified HD-GYP domain-containing signal transduction protein
VDLFVARQPIFDLAGELSGYELLYRRGASSRGADGTSTSQMSLDMIIQSFLEIGLERITDGKVAYLNFSRDMLVGGSWELLDPRMVVIEILEDIPADDEVLAATARLAAAGYRVALDDFVSGGPHERLVHLAEIIKVDVLNRPPEELGRVAAPLRERKLRLLAERVETAEVRDSCKDLGFELFQGYHFSRPELLTRRGISVEYASIVQLMNLLRDDDVSDSEIEEAFRRDPTLSYKLLRMVNAAAYGGRGVESILHGIHLLGRATLHRWLSLLLASSFASESEMSAERVHTAVLRARLCERLGESSGQYASGPLFMVGLFSMMDALLGMPMEELLAQIDLSPEMQSALLHRTGALADWLRTVEAYERGDWAEVARLSSVLGVSPEQIPELYLESLGWTRDQTRAQD